MPKRHLIPPTLSGAGRVRLARLSQTKALLLFESESSRVKELASECGCYAKKTSVSHTMSTSEVMDIYEYIIYIYIARSRVIQVSWKEQRCN